MLTPDALAQAAWRLEAPNIERTEPSHEPPVQHRGVVRVRTGPNRGIATRDQVRVLTERRRGWDLPLDQRAISGTTLRDLDMGLFTHEHRPSAVDPSVIREGGRSLAEQPSALHSASPDGVPTETGNAPTQWYWFSDRVENHNPGGLYGRANPETFGALGGNDYRNPTLAGALHRLGIVQRFGAGVPIARRACR